MEKKKSNHKKYRFTYIKATVGTLFVCLLFLKGYTPFQETGENLFHIRVNGQDVGTLGDKERIDELLLQARKNVVSGSNELVFMKADMTVAGEQVLWGEVDSEEDVARRMEEVLRASIQETLHRSYTLKVDEFTVNLASMAEVQALLQAAIDKYGNEGKFTVALRNDKNREFGVLTADVVSAREEEDESWHSYTEAGVQTLISGIKGEQETKEKENFEDFELGIQNMDFSEKVEIVESYLPQSQLTDLEQAINLVIMEQETPSVYEVASGDTLSEIALKVNIPMDTIVEMNDQLEDINSTLQIGDQLLITVPEPELSVTRVEEEYYEEEVQIENGVGLLRSLISEFEAGLRLEDGPVEASPYTIATGVSAAPFLRELAERAAEKTGVSGQVAAIENNFFGPTVDVAGLVVGGDLIAQLKGRALGERVLIPVNMLRHGGDVFLDDLHVSDVEQALGVPVTVVEQDGFDLLDAMLGRK